jgi:hypothetical protein
VSVLLATTQLLIGVYVVVSVTRKKRLTSTGRENGKVNDVEVTDVVMVRRDTVGIPGVGINLIVSVGGASSFLTHETAEHRSPKAPVTFTAVEECPLLYRPMTFPAKNKPADTAPPAKRVRHLNVLDRVWT